MATSPAGPGNGAAGEPSAQPAPPETADSQQTLEGQPSGAIPGVVPDETTPRRRSPQPQPPGIGVQEEKETPPSKFKFLDQEFEDISKAEHHVKSRLGQVRSLEERLRTTEEYANRLAAFVAQQNMAAPPGLQTQGQQNAPGAQPPSEAEPRPFEETVDWDVFERLYEADGPKVAGYWLAKSQARYFDQLIEQKLRAALDPVQTRITTWQDTIEAQQLFENMAAVEDEGVARYPALRQEASARQIAQIWQQLQIDPATRKSPYGVYLAYVTWLQQQGLGGANAAASVAPAVQRAVQGLQQSVPQRPDAIAGSGAPTRPSSLNPQQETERRVRQELLNAARPIPGLGFRE